MNLYSKKVEIVIPFILQIFEGNIGIILEIFPKLLTEIKSQEEIDSFALNIVDIFPDQCDLYTGSCIIWIIYEQYCNKDIRTFINIYSTKEKTTMLRKWIVNKFTNYQLPTYPLFYKRHSL
jgi:hypothetical protein